MPDKLAPAPALATPGGSHVPAAHAVVGGEVKGAERLLPRPDYPTALRAQGLSGKVAVAVAVNRKGAVVAARALGGPAPLQQAAEVAARKARFAPQRAARRSGTIVYDFTP